MRSASACSTKVSPCSSWLWRCPWHRRINPRTHSVVFNSRLKLGKFCKDTNVAVAMINATYMAYFFLQRPVERIHSTKNIWDNFLQVPIGMVVRLTTANLNWGPRGFPTWLRHLLVIQYSMVLESVQSMKLLITIAPCSCFKVSISLVPWSSFREMDIHMGAHFVLKHEMCLHVVVCVCGPAISCRGEHRLGGIHENVQLQCPHTSSAEVVAWTSAFFNVFIACRQHTNDAASPTWLIFPAVSPRCFS